jgi:RNA-binding protein YlmH
MSHCIAMYVQSGLVFVNWKEAKSSSATVHSGDVITIRGKGRVEILEIHETKKERYRIVMNRIS